MNYMIKKIISFLLVFVMLLGKTPVYAAGDTEYKSFTYVENGIEYSIKYYDLSHYEITNETSQEKIVINYDDSTQVLEYKEYENDKLLQTTTQKINTNLEDNGSVDVGLNTRASYVGTYKSANKVTCQYATSNGNNHWYNISTSSPKYVKIGCVATYERKYSTYQTNLDKYISAINSCNANYAAAVGILGTTDAIVLAAEIALIAAGAIITEGILLSILGIAGAGVTAGVVSMAAAYNDYLDVKAAYNLLT